MPTCNIVASPFIRISPYSDLAIGVLGTPNELARALKMRNFVELAQKKSVEFLLNLK
jgi:hypothetical protein